MGVTGGYFAPLVTIAARAIWYKYRATVTTTVPNFVEDTNRIMRF